MKNTFIPFANDSDSVTINGLTLENGVLTIAIYGNAEITHDQAGLAAATALRDILDLAIAKLIANNDLPKKISAIDPKAVTPAENPFKS